MFWELFFPYCFGGYLAFGVTVEINVILLPVVDRCGVDFQLGVG